MRRVVACLLVCWLAALGCGDDDDSDAESTTTESTTTTTEAPTTTAAPRTPEEQAFFDTLDSVGAEYGDEDEALADAQVICETLRAGGASLDLDASFTNLELSDASGNVVITIAPEFHLAATQVFCPEFQPQTLPPGG